MKPEAVDAIIEGLKEAGIDFIASLPSTGTRDSIKIIMNDPDFQHVPVHNEGSGIAICAGAYLGGKTPALLAENSGLVLGAYSLMGIEYYLAGTPLLMVLDHRGDFGDGGGYFYYGGRLVEPLLDVFRIPYNIVRDYRKFKSAIIQGQKTTEAYGKPAAVLVSGEDVW